MKEGKNGLGRETLFFRYYPINKKSIFMPMGFLFLKIERECDKSF